MNPVHPKVRIIGETKIDLNAIHDYLEDIGALEYFLDEGSESLTLLTEIMGRLCYRSWQPGLNPNVTRIRKDQVEYIKNLIDSGHGSVFEHATINFIFQDVSRVFTHELVRHRVGTAFSQESMRYVRIESIPLWIPDSVKLLSYNYPQEFLDDVMAVTNLMEALQAKWVKNLELDTTAAFSIKKKWTSMLRRFFTPTGISTSIGFSCNIRELRHLIKMRTDESAEEEMQLIFNEVAKQCHTRYPLLVDLPA